MRSIVLLSGGLDSATVLALAHEAGREIHALSFDYGQRHLVEIEAAKKLARHWNVAEHRVMTIDLRLFGGSALTADIEVPKNGLGGQSIPVTYVPARNTIFLSLALGYAETREAAEIWIGVNALDYSGYPDCRPEYLAAFQEVIRLGTRSGVERGEPRIVAPLLSWTKARIIARGTALGVDYGMTRSCYDPAPDGRACGGCDACILRSRGFAEAQIADPTEYDHAPNH
jgi:7-cyano-7-deazaguanine synthase